MKGITQYIKCNTDSSVNEGFIRNVLSIGTLARKSPEDLLTGVLNMYDYVCNNDDIKKFFMDFPLRERPFWKNIFQLYSKGLFGIFDINSRMVDKLEDAMSESDNKQHSSDIDSDGVFMVEVTPDLRRVLRQVISDSKIGRSSYYYYYDDDDDEDDDRWSRRRNPRGRNHFRRRNESLEIDEARRDNKKEKEFTKTSPSDPQYISIFKDPIQEKYYVFSINKQTNILRRIGNIGSVEFLKQLISKITQVS